MNKPHDPYVVMQPGDWALLGKSVLAWAAILALWIPLMWLTAANVGWWFWGLCFGALWLSVGAAYIFAARAKEWTISILSFLRMH